MTGAALAKTKQAKRTYSQHCGLARALDIVGERWTLLLVRELLIGPKRFKDLLEGLHGISPNLLAARLKELEADGLLRRASLPPPVSVPVYELTPLGQALEPVLIALGRWGFNLLGAPCDRDTFNPAWVALAMKTLFEPQQARGVQEVYEFHIGRDVFHTIVDDGHLEVRHGLAYRPACVLRVDPDTFMAIGARDLTLDEAVDSGRAQVTGDPAAWQRCRAIFPIPQPMEQAPVVGCD
jgi:DNA-binding HxlR family transcriptional regulator